MIRKVSALIPRWTPCCLLAFVILALSGVRAAVGCAYSIDVASESELNAAITQFNNETDNCYYDINLTADIHLNASTPRIDCLGNRMFPRLVDLYIFGNGHTVDGDDISGVRPFTIYEDNEVSMTDLTITGGNVPDGFGGGIYNEGVLTLNNCVITDNAAADGGGLFTNDRCDMHSGIISENTSSNRGGGVYNKGLMNLLGGTVSSNTAVKGAGIYNTYVFYSGGGRVAYNIASELGGGIMSFQEDGFVFEWLSLDYCTVTGNGAEEGGGVWLDHPGKISNSVFSDHTAERGAGVYSLEELEITGSTFFDNIAHYGGGIHATGELDVINSTISGNEALEYGGGLVNMGDTHLTYTTITQNATAISGGGVATFGGTVTMTGCIIADQVSGNDCAADDSTFVSEGYNLDSDGTCVLVAASDIIQGNADLLPLALDGYGTTPTHALSESSDALNAIPMVDGECVSVAPGKKDQRGVARPQYGGCDIGASEAELGTVTLFAAVTNDQGGAAESNAFGLLLDGEEVTQGERTDIEPGQTRTIDEVGLFGYDVVGITGDPECPSAVGGGVTGSFRHHIECTLNYDDIPPSLTMVVEADPEDGTDFRFEGVFAGPPGPPEHLASWGSAGAGPGQFTAPGGVAVDSDGNVYVADSFNHRIQKFDGDGNFLLAWGSQGGGAGQFQRPWGLAIDAEDNVYVADSLNGRVQRFDSLGAYQASFGLPGFLQVPRGIAVDSSGNVYVTDQATYRWFKFDAAGGLLALAGAPGTAPGEFLAPSDIAIDGDGYVYVADQTLNLVNVFHPSGPFLHRWATAGVAEPSGLAFDAEGDCYITELANDRLHKFTTAGDRLMTWGGLGAGPGQFNDPGDLVFAPDGTMYVVDTANHRVQQFGVADGIYRFTLDDESVQPGDGIAQSVTFTDVHAGGHIVTPLPPAGWQIDDAVCTGMSGAVSLADGTLSVTAGLAEDVTCTFFVGEGCSAAPFTLQDYGAFEACLDGPAIWVEGDCQCFDLDDDGSVSLKDFAAFQASFGG